MRAKLLATCACCIVASLGANAPGWAQEAEQSNSGEREEGGAEGAANADVEGRVVETVFVFGKAEEDPAEAPVAVTTFDAEQRNLLSAGTTRQMVDLTPGVYLSDYGLNIRGVSRGTPQTLLGSENSVAVYVDGFYNVDSGVIGESTLFGGNVEFYRGPQGTRYGRDGIGGAVNMISRAPSQQFRGEAVVGIGRDGWTNVGVNVSGPINEDFGYRVGAQSFNQPKSYQTNVAPGKAGFDIDNLYFEAQLEGDVTDRLHIRTRSTHFEYNNSPGYTAPALYNNGPTAPFMGALVPNPQYRYAEDPPTGAYEFNVDHRGSDRLTNNQVHILNADYDLGDVKLYYVGGYAEYIASGNSDGDGTSRRSYIAQPPTPAVPGTEISTYQTNNYLNDNAYYSHELRLEDDGSGPFEWLVGLYYLQFDYDEQYWNALPDVAELEVPTFGSATGPLAAPNPRRAFYEQRNILTSISNAVFADASWELNDEWRFSGGLRYTEDRKKALTNYRYIYWYPAAVVLDVTPAISSIQPRISNSGVTARFSAEYRPDLDTLIYTSYARGYKAGSFTLGNAVANNVTEPEGLNAYELGVRRDFGMFTADANVFFYDYHDLQVPITALNESTGGTFAQYVNADRARMYGLELQGTWSPTDALALGGNYTYLNSTYQEFCCAVNIGDPQFDPTTNSIAQDLAGNATPRAPEHKANIWGTYRVEFEPGSLIFGGSVSYTGQMYANSFERPEYRLDDYVLANATVTWRSADNSYDLVGSVTNLFENEYAVGVGVAGASQGFARTEYLGPPQFYSLTLRYRL